MPQARIKETDRIACMSSELRKMGVVIEELSDGMVVTGGKLKGSTDLESFKDHRIAMALSIAGLAAEGETVVRDSECAAVTYPSFVDDFKKMGANFMEMTI
ncbi:3-phosphoshikimate 1-carboxyvinyltransferase [bioreactor metagenome]|uniref:3-phosphoshikimate 1-carboxyvinyltransferase n=1 Tax=bioreactor metagenome TaxID=1076179 RepID=A0A645JA45_9ZZZZ